LNSERNLLPTYCNPYPANV